MTDFWNGLRNYLETSIPIKLPDFPVAPPAIHFPDSSQWMTEDEEVSWINGLGFNSTVSDLKTSYQSFVPKPMPAGTNVLWGTESDDLRNYYRLWKRTNYAGFLTQAQYFHDYQVNIYSQWQAGGSQCIEPEHVYLMGLIDWCVDNKDQPTLDAINRIIDFIAQKITNTAFYEQRVSARVIQCLAYYVDRINIRTDVKPLLLKFIAGVTAAPLTQGIHGVNYYVNDGGTIQGQPAGTDLRVLFPKNANVFNKDTPPVPLLASATTYNLKHFTCAASFQAVMVMHALNVAGRVLADPGLKALSLGEATAWTSLVKFPWTDSAGSTTNLVVPYNVNLNAGDLSMWIVPAGSSTPLYCTQMAAFATDPSKAKALQQQALLRQYGEYSKILSTEFGKKPKYFPWQTWEQGFFLTQK